MIGYKRCTAIDRIHLRVRANRAGRIDRDGGRAAPADGNARRLGRRSGMKLPMLCLALMLTTLAGCASQRLVQPGTARVDGLLLPTGKAWSQRGFKGERQWTIDGPLLNALEIYTGVQPGELLFDLPAAKRREGIRYRADMNDLEVQELVSDGLLAAGVVDVQLVELQPARLGSAAAIRFELSFANAAGLRYRALALASQAGGELTLLFYYAPAEYYFDRDRAAVEAIFDGARLEGGRQQGK